MRIFLLFLILRGATVAEDEARAPSGRDSSQPKPCVFCDIVAGKQQQEGIVYRDDKCVAFLSIGPRNPGHVLVVPLVHADNFLEVPADTMHAMTDAARKIVEAIRRTDLKCEGFVLQMNTGKAAGQTVFHAHLHVIPRFAGEAPEKKPDGARQRGDGQSSDGKQMTGPKGDESRAPSGQDSAQLRMPMSELEPVAAKIRAALAEVAKGN